METLYRKVAVSERKPKEGWVLTPDGGWLFKDNKWKCPHSGEEQASSLFIHWLEPIPDPTAQLKADKAELLQMLQRIIYIYPILVEEDKEELLKAKSLIQKHKQ